MDAKNALGTAPAGTASVVGIAFVRFGGGLSIANVGPRSLSPDPLNEQPPHNDTSGLTETSPSPALNHVTPLGLDNASVPSSDVGQVIKSETDQTQSKFHSTTGPANFHHERQAVRSAARVPTDAAGVCCGLSGRCLHALLSAIRRCAGNGCLQVRALRPTLGIKMGP